MRTKLLCILLTLSMVLTLTACGNSSTTLITEEEIEEEEVDEEVEEELEEEEDEYSALDMSNINFTLEGTEESSDGLSEDDIAFLSTAREYMKSWGASDSDLDLDDKELLEQYDVLYTYIDEYCGGEVDIEWCRQYMVEEMWLDQNVADSYSDYRILFMTAASILEDEYGEILDYYNNDEDGYEEGEVNVYVLTPDTYNSWFRTATAGQDVIIQNIEITKIFASDNQLIGEIGDIFDDNYHQFYLIFEDDADVTPFQYGDEISIEGYYYCKDADNNMATFIVKTYQFLN